MNIIKFEIFLLPLILFILNSCEKIADPTICTLQFVTYEITVIDNNSNPVDSLNVVVKGRSGFTFNFEGTNNPNTGRYTIMTDKYRKELFNKVEEVTVTGDKDNITFSEIYIFTADECHINKISGRDTIIVN